MFHFVKFKCCKKMYYDPDRARKNDGEWNKEQVVYERKCVLIMRWRIVQYYVHTWGRQKVRYTIMLNTSYLLPWPETIVGTLFLICLNVACFLQFTNIRERERESIVSWIYKLNINLRIYKYRQRNVPRCTKRCSEFL